MFQKITIIWRILCPVCRSSVPAARPRSHAPNSSEFRNLCKFTFEKKLKSTVVFLEKRQSLCDWRLIGMLMKKWKEFRCSRFVKVIGDKGRTIRKVIVGSIFILPMYDCLGERNNSMNFVFQIFFTVYFLSYNYNSGTQGHFSSIIHSWIYKTWVKKCSFAAR